ncbi:MAG: response regulator [Eubacterium sp.]|nr:response regulator [Eubacterium sp.]
MKLLVADDEDTIRKGVAKYIRLHTNRFDKVYEAQTGQEAIDLILKYQPEVVLLDVQMPIKTGIDVMKEMTKAGLNPITIILSGYDEFRFAQQAMKYGATEYLLKPIRANDILNCILEHTNEKYGAEEITTSSEKQTPVTYLVKEAQDYIAEHYTENLSLACVADILGISSGYLSTIFSQNLNCGFVDYLNSVRIDRACCYLEQNYLKTYEVAYKVGFHDEKYFSKVFKRIVGMTPREYRLRQI